MGKFKGFEARTDKDTPCFVINDGTLKNGAAAYKVQLGYFGRYGGDHSVSRRIVYNGKIGWLAKSKVKRGRAR